MKILLILALSIISAIFYRMGGSGRYNRLWRILGCPLLTIVTIWACFGVKTSLFWVYLLSFGLMCASVSTYWDFLFGFDNFWFHGFMLGVSVAPIACATGHWLGFILRCAVLSVFMGLWCKFWEWDIAEETGRGFACVASVLLLTL